MSIKAKTLASAQYAQASSAAQIYSPPTNPATTTIIDKFTVTNVTGSAATLSVYIVPSGNSAAANYMIVSALSIAANTAIDLTTLQNQILTQGDSLMALAGTGSAVVVRVSGREVT